MPVMRPYRRTCRQFVDGHYTEGGRSGYIRHPRFAHEPGHYVRAFLLLLKDLQELFDYVEPTDTNLMCYSYRIHALILRACVEVEANFKAILTEHGYVKERMTMADYKKVNVTHRLASYQVQVPNWTGTQGLRSPFVAWATGGKLTWYDAYNAGKHDRHAAFKKATFEHAIDACCGLLVVLSAQFETHDFGPGNDYLVTEGRGDGMESGIGGYFRVRFPNDWSLEERYAFNWQDLENAVDPFQTFDYREIV